MGTGSVYKLGGQRNKPWVALTAQRDVLGTFATQGEAVIALDAYNAQNTPAALLKLTFSEVYERWSEKHFAAVGEKGRYSYEQAYRKASTLHSRKIKELVTEDYQQIIDALVADGYGRSACEKQKQLFSQLCKWAMSNNIIQNNFAEALKLPPEPKKKIRVISAAEMESIQAIAADKTDPMYNIACIAVVLYYTGMRINELLTLKRENVFLDEGYMIGGEKTDAGRDRAIPILPPIRKIIGNWVLDSLDRETVVPLSKSGGPRKTTATELEFRNLMARLNIEGVVPHTLRKSAATKLIEGKAEPTAIQAILGHADFATTANYYTGHDVEYLKKEMAKFDDKLTTD